MPLHIQSITIFTGNVNFQFTAEAEGATASIQDRSRYHPQPRYTPMRQSPAIRQAALPRDTARIPLRCQNALRRLII